MKKWIAVCVVAMMLAGSASMFVTTWGNFQAQSRRMHEARIKLAQVEAAKQARAIQIAEAESWNQLWDQVRTSRINPDQWVSIPMSVSRDIGWIDLQELLLLVSNANTRAAGYWFRPKVLRVSIFNDTPHADSPHPLEDGQDVRHGVNPINVHIEGDLLWMKGG
ncbi:hypothetical protein [Desulfonatronum sp. SC1]|uniref:hypothetical protein n=1 Tax=Desulfonatronum sp. SC1 TaxID=2109626 RepID=UPI000D2FCC16|nr:hypothetical protein [Desulfonatronum sp. SC1]PTN34881.1 hypothetical protein C6366_12160 [Desulfonatronum sp. SC1]